MIFEKENKRIIEDCFSRDDWMSNFIMIIVQNRSTSLHCLCFVIFYRKKCFFETEQVEQNTCLYRLLGAFYNLMWFLKMKQKNHSRAFFNKWLNGEFHCKYNEQNVSFAWLGVFWNIFALRKEYVERNVCYLHFWMPFKYFVSTEFN